MRHTLYWSKNKDWRSDPVTERQKELIAEIEENSRMNDAFIPEFKGTTKGEACDYISEYLHASHITVYNPHGDAGDRV